MSLRRLKLDVYVERLQACRFRGAKGDSYSVPYLRVYPGQLHDACAYPKEDNPIRSVQARRESGTPEGGA